MAQLLHEFNVPALPNNVSLSVNNCSMTFIPFSVRDSISLLTLNFMKVILTHSDTTISFRFGLYSLNGGSLSLENFISGTSNWTNDNNKWVSLTATSKAQNITPGLWWWGLHASYYTLGANSIFSFYGYQFQAVNAFPAGFVGGAMTVSTGNLPASVATSDLDVTFNSAEFGAPMIVLSA